MPAAFLVAVLLASRGAHAADAGAVVVQKSALPATGVQSTLFTVPGFGRYAVTADSAQGTAVQLVTRASGPGPVVGLPGERNGRLDVFLDRGEYKVSAWSDPAGTGQARVTVRGFAELNVPAVRLPPLQAIATTLADVQQRTWWIEGGGRTEVEVAGRSLADLRLWRDGTWLVDVVPMCAVEAPTPGRDLRRCTISTTLDEGSYAVVAYGGASLPWASSSADQPLHARLGIPRLPEAGRARFLTSAFGVDRYLVPRSTERVTLALPVAADASLTIRPSDEDPFGSGTTARVTQESLPPQVSLASGGSGDRVVSVRGDAGSAYTLAWFPSADTKVVVPRAGHYFVATVPDGTPADSVDATTLLAGLEPGRAPVGLSAVAAGPGLIWERRFNLLAPTSVLVDVHAAGTYEVGLEGVEARFRVEPLVRPAGYQEPALQGAARVDLNPGLYRLTLVPTTAGIVTASVRPGGWNDRIKGALGAGHLRPQPLLAGAQFPDLALDAGAYPLVRGGQVGVNTGLVLRALPLDLDDAVPVWLGSEPVTLAIVANGSRILAVQAEDARPCELAVDGGTWGVGSQLVTPGAHSVSVRHAGTEPVYVSVGTRSPDRAPGAPLPAAAPVALPDFPVVAVGAPRSGDLDAESLHTYAVRVDDAALVRLETTGLLVTTGTVRTRTVTALIAASANGVGRNFLVQTWLGQGDYQLSVAAVAPSAGHYGVQLVPVRFRDGGRLTEGLPARGELGADEGIAYTLTVPKEGDYDLRSYGPGREFRLRFEDAAGFPLAEPEVSGARTWHLLAGDYRVVLLPERFPSRRITELTRTPEPVARNGHGPHVLSVDQTVSHVWWETDPRLPDTWQVDVPARVQAALDVDAEMIATLFRGDVQVARTVPGVTWTGTLEPGAYRVEAVNARRNSGVDYSLTLRAAELVAGASRAVRAPAVIPISVGVDGTYELTSAGDRDVRATLSAGGVVIAAADDRPADWNFVLRVRLAPGRYELKIDPVGGADAPVQVVMQRRMEAEGPAVGLGAPLRITPGVGAVAYPLETPAGGLLVVNAASTENLGVALDHRTGSTWEEVGAGSGQNAQVLVRLGGAAGMWRVRVWSMDGRGVPATLHADVVQPLRTTEAAFRSGFGVGEIKVSNPSVGAAVIRANHAGLFTVETASGTTYCPYADQACRPLPSASVPAALGELWLVRSADAGSSFRGRRVVVGAEWTEVAAGAVDSPVDVVRAPGISLLMATGGLLVDAGGGGPGRWDRGTGLTQDRSVALSLQDDLATIRVRAMSPALRPVAEGAVRVVHVALPDLERMTERRADGLVRPGAARRIGLPVGTDGVRVVVGDGTVVGRVDGGVVGPVIVGPVDAIVPGPGSELLVVNAGTTEGAFLVDTLGARALVLRLEPEQRSLERVATGAGTMLIDTRGPGFLHVRGAAGARLLRADGRLLEGFDLPADPAGGQLVIEHGAGAVLVWLDDRPAGEAAAFGPLPSAPPAEMGEGSVGARVFTDAVGSMRFTPAGPRLLHLRLEPGLLARVEIAGVSRIEVVAPDGVLDVVTPGAPVRIDVRRIGGGALGGVARFELSAPEATAEGLGPPHIFGGGDSRLFQFDVSEQQTVGLGVSAGADTLVARLVDHTGAEVGAGYVQMPELAAGRYWWVVHLPAGAAPVVARPVVVGLVRPDSGPPADVVRAYVESAR